VSIISNPSLLKLAVLYVNARFEWNIRKPSAVIMPKLRGCLTDGSRIEEGMGPQGAI